MPEPYDLDRFITAQQPVYDRVIRELAAAAKQSHWMWFIFPQVAGLGSSPAARLYALSGRGEASAYLAHPVLGERLRACTSLVNTASGRTAHDIFGSPDDLKFRSSMTLFAAVADDAAPFQRALDQYYGGVADARTLQLLNARCPD